MDYSSGTGNFKTNLEVALEVGLADTRGDALTLPGGAHDVFDKHRNRNGCCAVRSGIVDGGQHIADFGGIFTLHIVCIGINVFWGRSEFNKCHCSFLLNNFFNGLAVTICNGSTDFTALCFGSSALFKFFFDCSCFSFKSIEISFRSIKFTGNGRLALFQLFNGHFFQFHYETSIKILIFCFRLSISAKCAFSLSSDSLAPSSASERPLASMED